MSDTLIAKVFTTLKEEQAPIANDGRVITSQKDFAEALGLTKGYMSMLMKCEEPPMRVIQTLHRKYGINAVWLVSNGHEGKLRDTGAEDPHSKMPHIPAEYTPQQTITALTKALKSANAREEKLIAELSKATEMNKDLMALLKQKK